MDSRFIFSNQAIPNFFELSFEIFSKTLDEYFDYLGHFLRRIQVLPEGSVEAAEAEEPPLEEATSGTGPCPRQFIKWH